MSVGIVGTMILRATMNAGSRKRIVFRKKTAQIFATSLKSARALAEFQSVKNCVRPRKHYSRKNESEKMSQKE